MPTAPPVTTAITSDRVSAEKHRRLFTEFCRWEVACGGPDPHVQIAAKLASRTGDPAWFAGCYTASYIVSTAMVVTDRWSRSAVLDDEAEFGSWVADNWSYLPVRKERRVNGVGPAKLAEIMSLFAKWLEDGGEGRMRGLDFTGSLRQLDPPHHGRYFKTKLHETMRRAAAFRKSKSRLPEMDTLIPRGGGHSRKGLAMLYPSHRYGSDAKQDLAEADDLSRDLMSRLGREGVKVSWFSLEALLCNYRQAVSRGQYPGRAHDSELGHGLFVGEKFLSIPGRLAEVRAGLFDHRCLGEVGYRWSGRRVELGATIVDHGYAWSDLKYCYACSKSDLGHPVFLEDCQCA